MIPEIRIFGGLAVHAWGLLGAAAALAALRLALWEAPRRGVSAETVSGMWPWAVLGGIVGAHLYYMLAAGQEAGGVRVWQVFSGSAIQGGIVGGGLAGAAWLRRRGVRALPVLDVCAPGAAVAHALTRLGCFAAGCCYGSPTDLPWGLAFTHPESAAPLRVALHPAQLYEAALDLALAWLLHAALKRPAAPGAVFWLYVVGYGLLRFFVQFFRGDDAGRLILGLTHSQWTAFAMFNFAALMLRWAEAGWSPRVPREARRGERRRPKCGLPRASPC